MCTKNIYCETYLLNTCFSAQYYCLLWVLHRMVDLWKLLSLDFYSVIVCVQLSGCNSLTIESSYPSVSPGVYSNSCSLSQWCSLTISSSAAPFSFCLQSFPESGSFPMSQLFASGGQNIGASASVLPISIYFRIQRLDLAIQGTLKSLITAVWKHQFFDTNPSLLFTSHIHTWLLEKP